MLKQTPNPYGYRKLLAYQKAEELQAECARLTSFFPKTKTLIDLADQMNRSARSGKQNIAEGYSRNSTKEYYDFLGFSLAAVVELKEDCEDIWLGVYPSLFSIAKIMSGRGRQRPKGLKREEGENKGLKGEEREERLLIENNGRILKLKDLKFYPLDFNLPWIVQLSLRCQEVIFLIKRTQESLDKKMVQEKTLPASAQKRVFLKQREEKQKMLDKIIADHGLKALPNGRYVKVENYEKELKEYYKRLKGD